MPFFSDRGASLDQERNWVLLIAGSMRLLLPQRDVGEVEYLEGRLCESGQPGVLRECASDSPRRYVALAEDFQPLAYCPDNRFLATRIGAPGDELRWCWEELKVLVSPMIDRRPIPPVLLTPRSPFSHYVQLDGGLAYQCTGEQLRALCSGQEG